MQCRGDVAAEGDSDALKVVVDDGTTSSHWRILPFLKLVCSFRPSYYTIESTPFCNAQCDMM
jgi:hypothetical protein